MSLFGSMQVSASGMAAQRMRAELLVENMANSETTRTPEGGPYKRKDVVFSSEEQTSPFSAVFQNEIGTGVTVSDITVDQSPPELRYMPGHPDADANGYVAFPKMNPAEDMADLLNATRSYEANVAAISSVKDMISRSIDIMRT
jgi:flagellar basal-body rod protein FlgC